MQLTISALRINGDGNIDIEMQDPAGAELPAFTPGAHIDIRTPAGLLRQYSLCGPADNRHVYRICVRRDETSRGGSRSLHDDLRIRGKVDVSAPRNLFHIPDAKRYILISAGIGITPIISMARTLMCDGANFEFHHYERGRARVAFLDELTSGGLKTRTTLHLGDEGRTFRNTSLACLATPDPDAVVISCGPNGFLDLLGARLLEAGWLSEQFHSERFRPETVAANAQNGESGTFEVQIASSGLCLTIGPHDTIANVLQANNVPVDLSCEQGMCGACLTRVVSGTPDHRDIILSDAEKAANDQITICCSRASSALLVLDL